MVAAQREGIGISRHTRALVVGGGLAGLSAALVLAEAGIEVDLLEQSKYLGGRASSYESSRFGVRIDRGQHVLLGCCTSLIDFYRRIDALSYIDFVDSITFAGESGFSELHPCKLPEPLHLGPSVAKLSQLSLSDKARILKLIGNLNPKSDQSAAEWLSRAGQSKKAIKTFWEPILIGALNEKLEAASAQYAAMVVRQAMLINHNGMRLGIPSIPLGELNGDIPQKVLESLGVRIHLNDRVVRVSMENHRIESVETAKGIKWSADYIVFASSHSLIDEFALSSGSQKPQLVPEQVPIITLNLWFDRRIELPKSVCIPGEHFHWVLNVSEHPNKPSGMESAITMTASAARELMQASQDEICEIGLRELRKFSPNIPNPAKWAAIKSGNATFSPFVGCDKVRPIQKTKIPNLFLAGDWTATGWPGTMEGAVRSGHICAKEILDIEGIKCGLPVCDIPPKGLFKLVCSGNR